MDITTEPAPAELPDLIRHEIARVRFYLDGLEQHMAEHDDSGQWSPAQGYAWAAEADIRLRDSIPVAEWFNPETRHGTAHRLDTLTRALVAHVFSIGGAFARLSPTTSTRN